MSQSMLHRFRMVQQAELGLGYFTPKDRPGDVNSVTSLKDAEKWRADILKEIGRKVQRIQDSTLNDYEIRDLNDEINVLLREKDSWERRVLALGGADYRQLANKVIDFDGREILGARGYKYFGRAKLLPGVKESLEATEKPYEEAKVSKRCTLFDEVAPGYFGEEQDAYLKPLEDPLEQEAWSEAYQDFKASADSNEPMQSFDPIHEIILSANDDAGESRTKSRKITVETVFDADDLKPPRLFSRDEVQKKILDRQKKHLLARYVF